MKQSKLKEKISVETVKHVAELARLELSPKEAKEMQKDLNDILDIFKIMDKINPKCEPSFQPIPVKDVFREDVPEEHLTQEKALQNAKHKEDGFFKGPRVV